jgi:hypothetical protein
MRREPAARQRLRELVSGENTTPEAGASTILQHSTGSSATDEDTPVKVGA